MAEVHTAGPSVPSPSDFTNHIDFLKDVEWEESMRPMTEQ